jgi:predicted aminopeptidase
LRSFTITGKKLTKTAQYILFPVVIVLSTLQTGCYMLKQGTHLISDRFQAVSVEKIIQSDNLTLEEEIFFSRIASVNNFATDSLGLKKSKNYSKYIRTDSSYLAAVVSGAGSFSTNPYLWKFPFIGEVPYKGFFKHEEAVKEADKLSKKGLDTWIRGVDAFSTLGITNDPLYSFMTDYSVHRIAEMIIHEQTHATIWISKQTQFNEELAAVIGEAGAEQYISDTYGKNSQELHILQAEKRDRIRWIDDISELRATLETLYSKNILDTEKKILKQKAITDFKDSFKETYEVRYETDLYRKIPDLAINNAFISLYTVYYEHNTLLMDLFHYCGNSVAVLIELLKPLVNNKENPYDYINTILSESMP